MDETLLAHLAQPRFEDGDAFLVAGLSERYTCETSAAIPSQWQRFNESFGRVPGQRGEVAYGVSTTRIQSLERRGGRVSHAALTFCTLMRRVRHEPPETRPATSATSSQPDTDRPAVSYNQRHTPAAHPASG